MTAGEEWTLENIRIESTSWTLSSDAQMLEYMQTFSESLLAKLNNSLKDIEDLVNMTSAVNTSVNNTFNDFNMLSNVQFLESRVYEDDETAIDSNQGLPEVNQEEDSDIIAGRIRTAVEYGLTVMDAAFDVHSISPDIRGSDSEDSDSEQTSTMTYEPVMEAKDPYSHKILPYIIGSSEYCNDDSVGLQRYSETDDEDDESSEYEDDTDSAASAPRKDTRAGTLPELPGIPEQGVPQNDIFDAQSLDSSVEDHREERSKTKQSLFDDGGLFDEKKSDRTKAFESIFDTSSEEEEEEKEPDNTERSRDGSISKKPTGGVSIFGDTDVFRKGTVSVVDPDSENEGESQQEELDSKDVIQSDKESNIERTTIHPPPKRGLFSSSSDESDDQPLRAPSKKIKEPSIFDDGDDSEDGMFSNPKKSIAPKESRKITPEDRFSLFDSPSDDDDDNDKMDKKNIQDLDHGPVIITNTEPKHVAPTKKVTPKGKAASKSIADELNAKLNKNKPAPTKSVPTNTAPLKPAQGLFDSDDESEDMFSSKKEEAKTVEEVKVKEAPKVDNSIAKIEPVKSKIASIFDDSDSDDMFSVKPKVSHKDTAKMESESELAEPKSEAIKQKKETNTKFKTKGLFDDSDSDDMFSVTAKAKKAESVKISEPKPVVLPAQKQETLPTKQTPKVTSIFDDSDSDDMFTAVKTKSVIREEPPPIEETKTKVDDTSEHKQIDYASTDSDDNDMFAGAKPKVNISRDSLFDDSPPKAKAVVSRDTLFDDKQLKKSNNLLFDASPPEAVVVHTPKITHSRDNLLDSTSKVNISRDVLFEDSSPEQTDSKDVQSEDSTPKENICSEIFLDGSNPKITTPSAKETVSNQNLFDDDSMFGESSIPKSKSDDTDDIFANESPPISVPDIKSGENKKNDSEDEMFENISKSDIPRKDDCVVKESPVTATKITDDFDLFADDGVDDLFAVVSPRDRAKSRSKSKPVDPEFDLFADTSTVVKTKHKKSKSRSGSRSRSGSKTDKKVERKKSFDLFADDDIEPVVEAKTTVEAIVTVDANHAVEVQGANKSSKKPIGGVSLFGGVDITSVLKKKSSMLEREVPPPDDQSESDTPEEKQVSNIAKLQVDLNLSASMIQGQPKPSKRDSEPIHVTSGSTDVLTTGSTGVLTSESTDVLTSVTKTRVKGGTGRRPPTRGARRGNTAVTSAQSSTHIPTADTPKKTASTAHEIHTPETPNKTLDTSSDFFSTTESPYKSSTPGDMPNYSNDDDLFITPSTTLTSDPVVSDEPKHSTPNKTPQPMSAPKTKEKRKKKEVDIFDDDFDLFADPTPPKSSKKTKAKKPASDDLFDDDGDLFAPTKPPAKKKTAKKEKKNYDSLFEDPLS